MLASYVHRAAFARPTTKQSVPEYSCIGGIMTSSLWTQWAAAALEDDDAFRDIDGGGLRRFFGVNVRICSSPVVSVSEAVSGSIVPARSAA